MVADKDCACNCYHGSPHPLCVDLLSTTSVTALVKISQAFSIHFSKTISIGGTDGLETSISEISLNVVFLCYL